MLTTKDYVETLLRSLCKHNKCFNTIRQYSNELFKRNQIKYRKYEMKKTPKQLFLKMIPNNVNIIDCIQLKIILKIEDILSY